MYADRRSAGAAFHQGGGSHAHPRSEHPADQCHSVAYSTSGEWPALRALGTDGMVEYAAGLKRAGADSILTFAAEQVAAHLEAGRG